MPDSKWESEHSPTEASPMSLRWDELIWTFTTNSVHLSILSGVINVLAQRLHTPNNAEQKTVKAKIQVAYFFAIRLPSVGSTDRTQSYSPGFCLSQSCAISSVCIPLFPLSVNEHYTCLWKCAPCNFLSFPGSVRTLSQSKYVGLCSVSFCFGLFCFFLHPDMTLCTHKQLGCFLHVQQRDVKHQAEGSQGRHFPGVRIFSGGG